jgi:hypothetical protein
VENSQFRGRSRTSSHHSEVYILLFPKEQVEPFLEGTAPEPSLAGSGLPPVSLPLAGSPMCIEPPCLADRFPTQTLIAKSD